MRTQPAVLAVLTCLAWVGAAYAITWTLDMGSSQGWVAREWGLTPDWRQALRCELEGGIWRAMVNPPLIDEAPSVELVSPEIQAPAELFDELRVQVRLVLK